MALTLKEKKSVDLNPMRPGVTGWYCLKDATAQLAAATECFYITFYLSSMPESISL